MKITSLVPEAVYAYVASSKSTTNLPSSSVSIVILFVTVSNVCLSVPLTVIEPSPLFPSGSYVYVVPSIVNVDI